MRWSLSKLKVFEQCQAQYKYQYLDHLPRKTSDAATRGIDRHKLVEDFIRGINPALPPDLDFYTGFLNGLRTLPNFPEHAIFLRRDLTPTTKDDPDVWYSGILDLKVLPNENLVTLYDWKTGKIYEEDHNDQKEIYSLAAFAEHPSVSQVQAVHVYIDLGAQRQRTYHRDQVSALWEKWKLRVSFLERMDAANNLTYVPNPGFYCRYCSFSKDNGGPCRF